MHPPASDRQDWIRSVLASHERSLVAYAARLTGDLEGARDVAHETFLRLLEHGQGIEEPRLRPWLFRVCRQRAFDVLGKESPMRSTDPALFPECTDGNDDPSRALVASEEQRRVAALLEGLPNQREVLELKFRHGLSYREIGDVTEHPNGQVPWLIHAALKSLRESPASELRTEQMEGRA